MNRVFRHPGKAVGETLGVGSSDVAYVLRCWARLRTARAASNSSWMHSPAYNIENIYYYHIVCKVNLLITTRRRKPNKDIPSVSLILIDQLKRQEVLQPQLLWDAYYHQDRKIFPHQ